MLCIFYCVPLAWFLYFASSGIVFVLALFALKRGVYQQRQGLRTAAFCMMFVALFKILMVDLRLEKEQLLCATLPAHGVDIPFLPCTPRGMSAADVSGIVLFVAASLLLLQAWRVFMPARPRPMLTPQQVRLGFWSNAAMGGVIAMLCWLAAPWVGFLTVGSVPRVFTAVPWEYFAAANMGLLLWGFWQAESCAWNFEVRKKERMRHLASTWTARDTLWMAAFLYLLALALSYVSGDVLTMHGTVAPPQ